MLVTDKTEKKIEWLPWLICVLGALFYCYEYFLRVAPSVMTNDLMHSYKIGAATLGHLAAYYYYAYTPMQLPVGIMMDYYGPRRLLIFACIICALGTYLFGSTHLLWVAYLGRFFVGFGSAFAFVGVLKLATIWLPARYFGMISGLTTTLGLIGAMAGDFCLTLLVEHQGWRITVMYSAIFGIILALLIGLLMPDTQGKLGVQSEQTQCQAFKRLFSDVLRLLRNPHMWITGLIGCALYLPLAAFAELWGVPYLQTAYHYTLTEAAHTNSIIFLGFAIGGPLFGLVSDALRQRRLPMMLGALLTLTTILVILYYPSLTKWQLIALLFLFGVSCSAQVIVFAISRELSSPLLAGTAVAFTNMIVMVGGVIFQPVIGILLDMESNMKMVSHSLHNYSVMNYRVALLVLPIAAAISFLLLLILPETHGQQQLN